MTDPPVPESDAVIVTVAFPVYPEPANDTTPNDKIPAFEMLTFPAFKVPSFIVDLNGIEAEKFNDWLFLLICNTEELAARTVPDTPVSD